MVLCSKKDILGLRRQGVVMQLPAEDISVKEEPTVAEPQVRHDAGDEGAHKNYDEGYIAPHPGSKHTQGEAVSADGSYMLM